jgi:hypothetical protein
MKKEKKKKRKKEKRKRKVFLNKKQKNIIFYRP